MIILISAPLIAAEHGGFIGGLFFGGGLLVGMIGLAVAQTHMTDGVRPWLEHFYCAFGPVEYDTVETTVATGPEDTWRKHYKCDRCGQTIHTLTKIHLDTEEEETPG